MNSKEKMRLRIEVLQLVGNETPTPSHSVQEGSVTLGTLFRGSDVPIRDGRVFCPEFNLASSSNVNEDESVVKVLEQPL